MFVEERKEKIMEILVRNTKISVPELCKLFNVSPTTIRNDLRELSGEGLLKRTYGGAIIYPKTSFEPLPVQKEVVMLSEKKAIAQKAAKMVCDGDTIAIDTGTTTYEFAKQLIEKRNLTVVVNDLNIAKLLADNSDLNIIFLGGLIRKHFNYTYGDLGNDNLNLLNVDKAFVTCNGIDVEHGVTTPDVISASAKRKWLRSAHESILLCDSSKIGVVTFAQIAQLQDFTTLVTDNGLNIEDKEEISSKINLIVVKL